MGDEDLLEIIGNSKNIGKLQKHFKNMFAGVATLILSEDSQLVQGICSREGEKVSNVCVCVCVCVCACACVCVCVCVCVSGDLVCVVLFLLGDVC